MRGVIMIFIGILFIVGGISGQLALVAPALYGSDHAITITGVFAIVFGVVTLTAGS